jgi:hypothetical protein
LLRASYRTCMVILEPVKKQKEQRKVNNCRDWR